MDEQEALRWIGRRSHAELKRMIARSDALSDDERFDAFISSLSKLPGEELSATECVYLQGEAAQVLLATRVEQEQGRKHQDLEQRRQASIREVEVAIARLQKGIHAMRVGLGDPHLDPTGPRYRALRANLQDHELKLRALKQRLVELGKAQTR